MYQVKHFAEDRLDVQHALIEAHPLGLIICTATGRLSADPIPFILIRDKGELGTLRAHVARPNPLWQHLQENDECLVAFQAEDAYISPNWYPSKQEHGKVVPTWNYITVHAWGRPSVIDQADWLRHQISELTESQEVTQPKPWGMDDAPADFTKAMINGVVGVEIAITEIQGKWKVSQNRPARDIDGVRTGLTDAGALGMADQVATRRKV